ncbi:MAG: hypothetical protein QOG13_548 [Sphingomonadales bacterium]|jgi:hypothetical protein|nr:hypothetical protein [Sphingomonadales bacterium]
MSRLVRFLRDRQNRELLGWIGGGVIVLASAAWAVFIYIRPPEPSAHRETNALTNASEIGAVQAPSAKSMPNRTDAPPVSQNIVATEGSVVIGGNASNVSVERGN